MAGVRTIGARGRNPHIAQSEIELQLCRNSSSVLEIDEIDCCSRRRWGQTCDTLGLCIGDAIRGGRAEEKQRHGLARSIVAVGNFPSLRRQYLGDFTLGMTDPLIQPTEIRLD